MAHLKVGDRVRVKDRTDWPSVPGYRMANSEGTVVKWIEWQELMTEFQDYVHIQLEKTEVKEYIGSIVIFRVENLEKI